MIVQAPEMKMLAKKPDQFNRCTYIPHKLFDFLIMNCGFKTDSNLAEKLNTSPPCISRIRHGKYKIGPTMILAIYDATDLTIEDIRELLK